MGEHDAAGQSAVYRLADRYVEERAALDPIFATSRGIAGHDDSLTDFSPEGQEALYELARFYWRQMSQLRGGGELCNADRVAAEVMLERLGVEIDQYEAGERWRDLRIIGSPVQSVRSVFDLMPRDTAADWETTAARMERVPVALAGFEETLRAGAARGVTAARRQAEECAVQAKTWSEGQPFFTDLARSAPTGLDASLKKRLEDAAAAAGAAYGELARFLRDEYVPAAGTDDAVGADRYQLAARSWLGSEIDPIDTYRWGWSELHRIEAEMAVEADRVVPGGSVEEAKELLEHDPARAVEGEESLRRWIQDLMDSTIDELDGTHFDIPAPVKRVEAMIAPPGGAAAMYYTPPSEDFSRPGRTWYPTQGRTRFPLWGEVSIAYHEGVPGHHLQIGQVVYLAGVLSRFQRSVYLGGHSEGWALYAERLMDELGYLDLPDYRLGQLRAQAMRAVRVVVDIGMHLRLAIPPDETFHPGERWDPQLALEFAEARSHFPSHFMASEIVRYLGWPAQAICYKVGERVWLAAREEVRRSKGPGFDLKAFHRAALDLGPMGLSLLQAELSRL
jgi:uncharacterized protein (DUF885 family)